MYVGAVEEIMCVVCYRGGGQRGDECDLAPTLCKYDSRKIYLFGLSWARVRRVRWVTIFSELLMCSGCVRSILLLLLEAKCLETIDECIWRACLFLCLLHSGRC